ncbi:MAG TPA: trigger factor [Syntrophomonadaceae bacterium]|nr:trigger factor [Syntrophomonadaceae bacterium]
MRAALERLDKNQVTLQIEVEADQVEDALQKAYQKVVKRVNIPGFRRGKVPRPILEARLGKEVLYEEALDILLPQAYREAVQQQEVEPIDQPKIDVIQMEKGRPLIFKATVEVLPEVKLGNYKGIEAVKPEVKVGDDEVEAHLKLLQQRHARLVDAGDGTVDDGDIAVINLEATVDGKPEPRLGGQERSVEVGSGKFIPGFEAHLLGMKLGEEKEFTLHLPSLYQYPDLEGKEACFKVKVVGIKRKELSPIDDEFARDVSECSNLQELKEQLRNKLEEVGRLNARRIFTERVVQKVVEQAEVELPEILVKRQMEQDTQDFIRRLAYQRLNLEDYLRITNKDFDTVQKDLEAGARDAVKRSLVLGAIAKAEGIKVTPEEVEAEINDMAAQYNMETDKLRKSLEERGQLASIEEGILMQKVQEFLRENAVELPDEPVTGEAGEETGAGEMAGVPGGTEEVSPGE